MLFYLKQTSNIILKLFVLTAALLTVACGGTSGSSSGPAASNPGSSGSDSLPPNVSAALAKSGIDLSVSSETGGAAQESSALHAIYPDTGVLDEHGAIRMVFTNPVDSEATTPDMIQLYNETRSEFVDLDFQFIKHEVTIVPTTPPSVSDQYILLIHKGVVLTSGSPLQTSFWADFTLPPREPLKITFGMEPAAISHPSRELQIIFNSEIDAETVADNVTFFDITSNSPEDFEFRKDPGQHGFFINPSLYLKPDHTYELTVKAGVQDVDGRSLGYDFVKQYTVASGPFHPAIDIASPARGQQDFDPASPIIIQFSEMMDPSSVDGEHNYIRTYYGTDNFVPSSAYIDGNRLFIVPATPLAYDRSYQIELPYQASNWLVATNGYQLAGRQTIKFRTIKAPE